MKLVSKRIKAIRLAEPIRTRTNLDKLASNSDDEQRMSQSEKRVERKVKQRSKQTATPHLLFIPNLVVLQSQERE